MINYVFEYIDSDGNIRKRSFIKVIRVLMYSVIKFIFDRLFALIGIIVFSPLLLIIAIAIKLEDGKSVLFKQKRPGKNGKIFDMCKFRSMAIDNDYHDFSTEDKHTKVGKFLRKTSLDEIPQLFQIFIGKMSFIGPRPWIKECYDNMNDVQKCRYSVRPGLTGLAQCKGRNSISIFDKIKYDLQYVEKYSLFLDILIIFMTFKQLFKNNGTEKTKKAIEDELNELKLSNENKENVNR